MVCICAVSADVIIKEQLQSLKHKEFETAKLRCKVKNPKKQPVKWFKNGQEIKPGADNRCVLWGRQQVRAMLPTRCQTAFARMFHTASKKKKITKHAPSVLASDEDACALRETS